MYSHLLDLKPISRLFTGFFPPYLLYDHDYAAKKHPTHPWSPIVDQTIVLGQSIVYVILYSPLCCISYNVILRQICRTHILKCSLKYYFKKYHTLPHIFKVFLFMQLKTTHLQRQ